MPNKFYNQQVAPSLKGKKAGSPTGAAPSATMKKHTDVWPGLPGKTGSWPASLTKAEVCSSHPTEEGLN